MGKSCRSTEPNQHGGYARTFRYFKKSGEHLKKSWQITEKNRDVFLWQILCGKDIAGLIDLVKEKGENSTGAVNFRIQLLEKFRNRDLLKSSLEIVAEKTKALGKSSLRTISTSYVPYLEDFHEEIGAEVCRINRHMSLDLKNIDRDLISDWIGVFENLTQKFKLEFREGMIKEEDLAQYLQAIQDFYKNLPVDKLNDIQSSYNREKLMAEERMLMERNDFKWTYWLREKESNRIVGFTSIAGPKNADHIYQLYTCVLKDFRRKGIGRMLKAFMIERALSENTGRNAIKTSISTTNRSMLNINKEMGFIDSWSWKLWQIEIQEVEKYLLIQNYK